MVSSLVLTVAQAGMPWYWSVLILSPERCRQTHLSFAKVRLDVGGVGAEDPDREAGPGEGVPLDQLVGQTQRHPDGSHLPEKQN